MGSVSSICSAQEDNEAHEESQEDAQNIVERVYSAKKGRFEAELYEALIIYFLFILKTGQASS